MALGLKVVNTAVATVIGEEAIVTNVKQVIQERIAMSAPAVTHW